MARPQPQALVGTTLGGRYVLEKFIGSGAFAWVFLAKEPGGTKVAVKVLQNATDEARKLFTREIKVLRQLPKSPFCVAYVDDGLTNDQVPFLVMEFVDGATLKDTFKFQPVWEAEEGCQLMIQLCEALGGLHQLGLAHRDLKPENVMLTRTWKVKLMDFGLVKDAQGLLKLFETEDIVSGRDFAENIDKALLAGTPEYMAPEQFSDPLVEDEALARTDTWTDVYSLGLIFSEILTGKKLFPLKTKAKTSDEYTKDLFDYIRGRSQFTDAQLVRPDEIPEGLWPTITRALRQNPKQRYPTAQDMARDIKSYLEKGTAGEDFEEFDQQTSVADMDSLSAALESFAAGGAVPTKQKPMAGIAKPAAKDSSTVPPPKGKKPISNRPPAEPKVDVAKIQQYREDRLNKPGKPEYTLPPGQLRAEDLFNDPAMAGALPQNQLPVNAPAAMNPAMQQSGAMAQPVAPPVQAMQVAPAPAQGGGNRGLLLVIAGLLIVILGGAVGFLLLKK